MVVKLLSNRVGLTSRNSSKPPSTDNKKDQNKTGKRYVASFPDNVRKAVQYGDKLKAHAVYMPQYQLLPYNRVQEFFTGQLGTPLSEGSIYNFSLGLQQA